VELKMPYTLKELEKEFNRSFLYVILLIIGNISEEDYQFMDKKTMHILVEGIRDLIRHRII
jgi:hypothetical protein